VRRREFIAGLGAAAWPVVARAQQGQRLRRVGALMDGVATEAEYQLLWTAFSQRLRQLGWVESQNLHMDVRWSAGDGKLASIYAAQLIALMPDVILVSSTPNLLVIREATKNVPIVFVNVSDPVAQGFVANIRQPGGNLTGFSLYEFSIGGKWLSLLKEAAPGLARVAVMFNPDTSPQSKFYMRAIDSVAPSLGVQAIPTPVRATAEIESALATFARQPNGGLILPTDTFIHLNHTLIADLAGRYRLPSISAYPEFVKDGGLMEYSSTIDRAAQLREAANYIGLILKGSRVGDLPVQAPDKYRFVLNMKTAKALGVTLPPTMLAIADEVIE
jgi:putative tryptophan/tyrosine transport system substrate-binding protein